MNIEFAQIPIIGFAAASGVGKTTLLIQLIPLLKARGIRISLVKHAHHHFDIDYPGKDSYELRKAGASPVLVASRYRWALVTETAENPDNPRLSDILSLLLPQRDQFDLILVEGFKRENFPKIELHRPALGHPPLFPQDSSIIAIATDTPLPEVSLPQLDLNRPEQIAHFIMERVIAKSR